MRRRALALSLSLALAAPAAGPAATTGNRGGVTVTTSRAEVATVLGERFSLTTRIANDTVRTAGPVVATLNVTSLVDGVYVDPEDWSGERTRYLGRIAPGASIELAWPLQAVTSGNVAVYVTALELPVAGGVPSTSPVVHVAVARRSTIDAGGALFVALGVPAIVGLLALAGRVARRRRS